MAPVMFWAVLITRCRAVLSWAAYKPTVCGVSVQDAFSCSSVEDFGTWIYPSYVKNVLFLIWYPSILSWGTFFFYLSRFFKSVLSLVVVKMNSCPSWLMTFSVSFQLMQTKHALISEVFPLFLPRVNAPSVICNMFSFHLIKDCSAHWGGKYKAFSPQSTCNDLMGNTWSARNV